MTPYKKFEYKGDIQEMDDPIFRKEQYEKAKQIDQDNLQEYARREGIRKQIQALYMDAWPSKRNKPNLKAIDAPPKAIREYNKLHSRWQDDVRVRQEREKAREARQRKWDMIARLQSLGFVPEDDFKPSQALAFAKKALIQRGSGEYEVREDFAPKKG